MIDVLYDNDSPQSELEDSNSAIAKTASFCEFTSGQSNNVSVRGNLAKHISQWEKIGAPGFILSVIREGYKIPFIDIPSPKHCLNNGFALKEKEFVGDLASVVGQIISITPCVGNVTRIMTRSLYAVVNRGVSWSSMVELTREAQDELKFWNQNVDSLNGCSPWRAISKPTKLVYSDASSQACGSFIENKGNVFHQNWSQIKSKESYTWRELKAVGLALTSFATELKGRQVAWFTDNDNVVSIIHKVSKVKTLQSLELLVFKWCIQYGISLKFRQLEYGNSIQMPIN